MRVVVSARLDKEFFETLVSLSREYGVSVSDLLRVLLAVGLKRAMEEREELAEVLERLRRKYSITDDLIKAEMSRIMYPVRVYQRLKRMWVEGASAHELVKLAREYLSKRAEEMGRPVFARFLRSLDTTKLVMWLEEGAEAWKRWAE